MTPEDFLRRKREIERLTREEERERGRLEECLKRVRKLSGTDDLKRAKKKLAKLQSELEQEQRKIDRLWREWDDRWKEKLEEA